MLYSEEKSFSRILRMERRKHWEETLYSERSLKWKRGIRRQVQKWYNRSVRRRHRVKGKVEEEQSLDGEEEGRQTSGERLLFTKRWDLPLRARREERLQRPRSATITTTTTTTTRRESWIWHWLSQRKVRLWPNKEDANAITKTLGKATGQFIEERSANCDECICIWPIMSCVDFS